MQPVDKPLRWAGVCYGLATVPELESLLTQPVDLAVCEKWEVSPTEYYAQIKEAIDALLGNGPIPSI